MFDDDNVRTTCLRDTADVLYPVDRSLDRQIDRARRRVGCAAQRLSVCVTMFRIRLLSK